MPRAGQTVDPRVVSQSLARASSHTSLQTWMSGESGPQRSLMQEGCCRMQLPFRVLRVRGHRAGSQSGLRTDGEASPGVASTKQKQKQLTQVPRGRSCQRPLPCSARIRCSPERLGQRVQKQKLVHGASQRASNRWSMVRASVQKLCGEPQRG